MPTLEIVIDGTDCSGKTPLVEELTTELTKRGYSTRASAPFAILRPYPRWQTDSINTAKELRELYDQFRVRNATADIIIWDRGWPTVWVDTECDGARALFPADSLLTVLLISGTATVAEKVAKYQLTEEHLVNVELRDSLNHRYRRLAASLQENAKVFSTSASGRFDLTEISRELISWIEEALATKP